MNKPPLPVRASFCLLALIDMGVFSLRAIPTLLIWAYAYKEAIDFIKETENEKDEHEHVSETMG